MLPARFVLAFALSSSLIFSSTAQQTATPSTQAVQLLRQSLAALTAGTSLSDVTLSGSARRIVGGEDETGSGTLKALATGASRLDLSLASGSRSEITNLSGANPTGTWSGPDGVSHPISYHNLMIDPSWFPAFPISRALSSGYATAYVGQETREGQSVQHLQIWQTSTITTPAGTPTFEHLTQIDLYLDATTLLPAALTFNTHADDNMLLDIPVELRFSDYRSVNADQIPFHILKFLNNSLLLDLRFQSATLNSGLTAASISL